MIARYKNQYFCIDTSIVPVQIWAYVPVDGFEKKITRRGTIYWEKFIDISEIDELFDVAFAVEWRGSAFNAPFFKEDTVYLRTGDKDEATKYGFQEEIFDRGEPIVWCKIVDIDEIEKFFLYKTIYAIEYFNEKKRDAKQKSELVLSKEDWLNMRAKTETELSPWNYANK